MDVEPGQPVRSIGAAEYLEVSDEREVGRIKLSDRAKALPESLYKYCPFNAQTLRNLKAQIIYFASPKHFNDPYDCALLPGLARPTAVEVEALRAEFLAKDDLPPRVRSEFEGFGAGRLREQFLKSARQVVERSTNDFIENRGVACFSEAGDDLLMWSHYSDRCRGICLEFTGEAGFFGKARKVRYVSTLPVLDTARLMRDDDFDDVTDLFCTKSKNWAYEKEWRVIHREVGTEFGYKATDLTGVYFGPEIDRRAMEIVCLILRGQNETVRFWRGQRSASEFRMVFEEFNYTSYLDAKRTGLA